MSFTSNSWKQSGGLNRNKTYQNVKSDQMAPSNLNITKKLGIENSITPNISYLESSPTTFLYNFQNGKNFNNNIGYYPFNNEINTIGVSNESLNPILNNPSNFDLNYQVGGTALSLVSSPFNQSATQFSQNAKTLISDFSYNTQNIFGTNPANSVSFALTISSHIYVSSDASNFCFFAMDDSNQTALNNNGSINTGISNESLYLWYPDNDGKATIYYTTINPTSGLTYGFSNQLDIVLKDQWHTLTLTLNGQYVYININDKTVFKKVVSVGTRIPNQPIAINLSSKSYDSSTNTVITNGSTNSGNIQLLDYNIFNLSFEDSTIQNIVQFRDSIKTINNANEPNRNLYLNYTIGENINYLASKIIAGNGIGNNGSLTNYGELNNFSIANFYDKTTFYGPVQFDSSVSIIYDSSINSSLEIYTLPGKAGTVTSSFLIENAGAVPGNSFNPTMVVYNGTSTQINPPLPTQGLIFSISGENVSVGDIFGTHTFDVSGSSYLNGNLTINDTQNGGYGSYPTSTTGTIILRHSNGDDTTNYNGSTGIVFRGPKENGNDWGAIGYIDNIGTTSQSQPSSTIPASYNYYQLDGSENSCLFITSQNDGTGGSGASVVDSLVLRSSGYFILDTGNYNIASPSDYPNSNNRLLSPTAPGPISILPNGGSVGIGKLNPNSDYTLDMCGNLLLCAKGSGASQQPTLTLQYDTSPYTYISSSSITDPTSSFSGQLTFQAGSFNFNNSIDVIGNLDISGNLSANNVGPSSDNQLEPNVASVYLNSVSPFSPSSLSQLNMNGYMFTRAILNYSETASTPTGLIFGNGSNTQVSDVISLVTAGTTRLQIIEGGHIGIGTIPNGSSGYILDVNGNINVTGSITSTGACSCSSYNTTSDLRLKENITDLDNSLEKICNIRGVSYNLKSDENKTKTSGVIAQEVIEHIPEAVDNMDSEKLSVNYNSIIAHLIESVKELNREIEELKSKN